MPNFVTRAIQTWSGPVQRHPVKWQPILSVSLIEKPRCDPSEYLVDYRMEVRATAIATGAPLHAGEIQEQLRRRLNAEVYGDLRVMLANARMAVHEQNSEAALAVLSQMEEYIRD